MPNSPRTLEQLGRAVVDKAREMRRQVQRKIYNSPQFQQLRIVVLSEEPICQMCNDRPSVHVDHIEPIAMRPDLALTRANLQGLCDPCHGRKTNDELRTSRSATVPPPASNEVSNGTS